MKHRIWLLAGCLTAANLMAQVATTAPALVPTISDTPAAPAAEVNPAPKKTEPKPAVAQKKPAPRKPVMQVNTAPLVPGPALVVASNVNVRAQGRLRGEVIGQLTKGDSVTVVEEIILKNSGQDEPSAWAKISLPAKIPAYLHSSFLDTNGVVKARRLNLRGGPGENYSVIGRLQRGDAIKQIGSKGEWVKIEAPVDAYAFMAAQYLTQEGLTGPAIVAATTPPNEVAAVMPPPETTAPVAEPPAIAPAPSDAPAIPATTNEVAAVPPDAGTNDVAMEPVPPEDEEPPPPRIVQREGFVRGTVSIQAPTHFGLVEPENKRLMNYLYSTSPELDLSRYKGLRIIVTGEESLDKRWPNTPVISIQRILVIN